MLEADRIAVAFARLLRGAGLDVPVGSTVGFARALECVGVGSPSGVYWAGRATLVRRPDDFAVYDRAFDAFWTGTAGDAGATGEQPEPLIAFDADLDPDSGEADDTGPQRPAVTVRWSPVELLRERDFASYTPTELEQARRLMAELRWSGARRRSRRRKPAPRGGAPDLRRSVRRSLRAGKWCRPRSRRPARGRARWCSCST